MFGCLSYAHIKQDKLDARVLECVFVRYPDGVKGNRLWCLEPGYKCIISKDIIFDESKRAKLQTYSASQIATSDKTQFEVELSFDRRVEFEPVEENSEVEQIDQNNQSRS